MERFVLVCSTVAQMTMETIKKIKFCAKSPSLINLLLITTKFRISIYIENGKNSLSLVLLFVTQCVVGIIFWGSTTT